MILDVEPEEDDEDEEEEEEEGDESIEGEERMVRNRAAAERRHHRMASDLSIIESSAEMLYGLIHQRFICSRAGIQQMSDKFDQAHFGVCPRTFCDQVRTLPVGLSDIPGEDTVKLFCPSCLDVYVPPSSRFQTVDGAFFGRTFGALFLLTFPEYDVSKKGAETLAGAPGGRPLPAVHDLEGADVEKINGMNAYNLAPGLGRSKVYEPKIYGFKVSERARSGPRMSWLRQRPPNIQDLDEAAIYAAEHGDDSDDDSGINGAPTRQQTAPTRPRPNGSPMSVDANGDVYA
jgi:casein kinase II subunit beta